MSVKQTNKVWTKSPYVQGVMLTHVALADGADIDGIVKISHGLLAEKTNASLSTVKRHIAEMIADGMLEITHQGGGYPGDCSSYKMLWPKTFKSSQPDLPRGSSKGFIENSEATRKQSTHELHNNKTSKEQVETPSVDKEQVASDSTCVSSPLLENENPPMSVAEILAARKAKPTVQKVEKAKPKPSPETLQAQQLLRDRWDAVKAETGKDPLWSFPGVMKIIQGYIKGGHTAEDIEYLLDNSPVYSKAAFQLCLSQKGSSTTGRAQVNEAMSALDDFVAQKKTEAYPVFQPEGAIIEVDEAIQGELT